MYFIAKIKNSSLGACFKVDTIENGVKMIKDMTKKEFGRKLTITEEELIENDFELIYYDFEDNKISWAIGTIE